MTTKFKSALFWAIWLIIVLSVVWWFAWMASGATPPIPGKKKWRQSAAVHQGAGALLLITKAIIPPPVKMWTNQIAWDHSALSTVSNFIVYRGPSSGLYTNSQPVGKTLTTSFVWTKGTINFLAVTAKGTNGLESLFSNEIRIPGWPKSNTVITVTCMNGGTNIAYSPAPTGPWTKLNTTNWTATNPPAPRYFRGIGSVSNFVKISEYSY